MPDICHEPWCNSVPPKHWDGECNCKPGSPLYPSPSVGRVEDSGVRLTITVTKRANDWHVCLKDHPEHWGCGWNAYEAIGNLIYNHPNVFGIAVERAALANPESHRDDAGALKGLPE